MLNTLKSPLNNVTVRQALAYGINYQGIDQVLKGAFKFTSGIIPPGLWGYSTNLPNYRYDPSKAKALLARAGYGPGKKPITLSMTYITGDPIEGPSAEVIKSSWAPLNVKVNLEPLQWQVLWAKTKSQNLAQRQDAVIYQWWPDYPDPYSWFTNLYATQKPIVFNASYYSNSAADALMQRAEMASAYNRAKSAALYQNLQAYLLQQAPAIPTGTLVYQRAMLSSVHGFTENPLYPNCVFAYNLHPAG
jgi:peptide/nickel transport system substrate-binding protein